MQVPYCPVLMARRGLEVVGMSAPSVPLLTGRLACTHCQWCLNHKAQLTPVRATHTAVLVPRLLACGSLVAGRGERLNLNCTAALYMQEGGHWPSSKGDARSKIPNRWQVTELCLEAGRVLVSAVTPGGTLVLRAVPS